MTAGNLQDWCAFVAFLLFAAGLVALVGVVG
jgi:hypothetical protein